MSVEKIFKEFSKDYQKEIKSILSLIKKYDRIAIFRHIKPDFDALGSQFGLATWIKDNFPNKEVLMLGDNHVVFTPRLFKEMDDIPESWNGKPFLSIILDTSNASRIADPRWEKGEKVIRIDHHPLVENFADVSIVNTKGCAAAENVANVLLNFKGKYVFSKEAASYFYIGIVGDSGRFMFSSVSKHTFNIASKLLDCGIQITKIYQQMYMKQIDDLYVTAYVLGHFNVSPKGVAYYVLDNKIQNELKITTERGKENVNLFSNIEGIGAWCSITEDVKDKCWRVSIRSKETPINGVAAMFEGGGHAQASGAKLNSLDDLPKLIAELDKLF